MRDRQLGLRSLIAAMAGVAGCMLVVGYGLRNQGDYLAIAIVTSLGMVLVTFALFALMFVMLLPFGIIEAMARESAEPASSPFSTDRLPEQRIAPIDTDPGR